MAKESSNVAFKLLVFGAAYICLGALGIATGMWLGGGGPLALFMLTLAVFAALTAIGMWLGWRLGRRRDSRQ
jgi:membrane protein implicated in regulation of membrane protease activity